MPWRSQPGSILSLEERQGKSAIVVYEFAKENTTESILRRVAKLIMVLPRTHSTFLVISFHSRLSIVESVPFGPTFAQLIGKKGLTKTAPEHPIYILVIEWSPALVDVLKQFVTVKAEEDSPNKIASTSVELLGRTHSFVDKPKGKCPQKNARTMIIVALRGWFTSWTFTRTRRCSTKKRLRRATERRLNTSGRLSSMYLMNTRNTTRSSLSCIVNSKACRMDN